MAPSTIPKLVYPPRTPSRSLSRGRIASALALVALACSSSSKTVATDSCSPGEVTPCAAASGCPARKTCNPDGRTYGPCECIFDGGGGSAGSSSGAAGRGGTGATSGRGGTGPAGAGGTPTGGSAGGPPGGSGGGPAGSAGVGGPPPPDGSAGVAGGPAGGSAGAPPMDGGGPGGMAGSAGGGSVDAMAPCLNCMRAIEAAANPNDPRICPASRNLYTAMYDCVCMASAACAPPCGAHCANPMGNPFTQTCQTCVFSSCPNVASSCANGN